MQIFNIHKQAEFTKNNEHVSLIVYRIQSSVLDKGTCNINFRMM